MMQERSWNFNSQLPLAFLLTENHFTLLLKLSRIFIFDRDFIFYVKIKTAQSLLCGVFANV